MKANRFLSMVLSVCLAVLTLFSFVGCGEEKNNKPNKINISNFELSISTGKNVFSIEDEIPVDIFLKNGHSFDIEITYFFLIDPVIPTATNYPATTEMPQEPYRKKLNKNGAIQLKDDLGGYFDVGFHEIKYKSTFYINWGKEGEQRIEIYSNTIQIEITKREGNQALKNENAVYAYVTAGYEEEILSDVEGAFAALPFQKVYLAEKNTNEWTPLSLLFILDKNGEITQEDFIALLNQDERINHAHSSRDLPFETVDTRYIEKEKDKISVGETLQLTLKGSCDYYVQPFDFKGFFVKPIEAKEYTVQSFPDVALKSVREAGNGWLYLELADEGYLNLVEACDKVARLSTIEKVEKDKSNVVSIIPSIWQVSDETVVGLQTNSENYNVVTVTGLKKGKVTVDFGGVTCEITVQ